MRATPLTWYLRRLRAMPPAEIAGRAWRWLRAPLVRRAIRAERLPAALEHILARAHLNMGGISPHLHEGSLAEPYLEQLLNDADNVLAHRVILFDDMFDLGERVDWYRDYAHRVTCPRVEARRLNCRAAHCGGMLHLWWLNRQQHLMPAAIAHFVTGRAAYAQEVARQLEEWLVACPYPLGPAWMTGIEAGVRLLTWSWLFRFLFAKGRPAAFSDPLLLSWCVSIRQHVAFITQHWSKYSSANNHLVAEAAGVLAAVTTLPALFPDTHLAAQCRRILTRAVAQQVSPDGVSREQSVSYHAFVMELLLNACLCDDATRAALSQPLSVMTNFLDALLDEQGNAPDFGDADHAVATGILPRAPAYYAHVLSAARGVITRDTHNASAKISHPCFWYTGSTAPVTHAGLSADCSGGGYVVWRSPAAVPVPLLLCMDVGPLGLGSLAAHGHADGLSFTLHANGEPVLIDPGTFAYHTEPLWRDYFRGTRAHNTLCLDRANQAVIAGPFLWGKRYAIQMLHLILDAEQCDISARLDGYRVPKRPRSHQRRIQWLAAAAKFIITDLLVGADACDVELLFHVHPDRAVTQTASNRVSISGNGYALDLILPSRLSTRIARGETDPPLGWHSPVVGRKTPCATIVAAGSIPAGDPLITEIVVRPQ